MRGLTLYSPDARAPLHPNVLGEGAASLLPGEDRWALLWSIDLDADGTAAGSRVERAIVRSRAALGYPEVQAAIDDGTAEEPLMLLREIGLARLAQEEARGALSLDLPAQKVVARSGGYDLEYVTPPAVERWNAQVSLLTGMEAARIMIAGGVGLLRTLPPPEPRLLAAVRRSAAALGVPWPAGQPFAAFVRGLDRSQPGAAALLNQVARTLRGAGYVAFSGTVPEHGHHAAVAAPYSHVTAPIRRLCDRFTNEVVLALAEGRTPPEWATAALPDLPRMMGAARQRERALSNAALDFMEAAVLEHHVGEAFEATVTDIDGRSAVVQICEPAVLARMAPDGLALGDHVEVRLTAADPATRTVAFARA